MGFVKAFGGAIGGSFADQWKDFYTVPSGIGGTVGICRAVPSGANVRRSSNRKSNEGVITDGSLILVPEGFALITMESGAVTGYVSDPGGYRWSSSDPNSKSFLSGSGMGESLVRQSWERFKYGGAPAAFQTAVFVNLKEIPGNKFGTQGEIYWDDAYLNAQAGAIAHGTYTLQIVDPILFLKGFVPTEYYMGDGPVFDFADYDNPVAEQLFSEVVGSLAGAFSAYANDPAHRNRIADIQGDSVGFARSLSVKVEESYRWSEERGVKIVKAALMAVDYDESTKSLLQKVRQADALMGARGNANLQASFAEGIRAAGQNPDGGALGMGFMGMGMQGVAGAMGSVTQPDQARGFSVPQQGAAEAQPVEDPYERLAKLKKLLDQDVITQEDFDAAKAKLLDL